MATNGHVFIRVALAFCVGAAIGVAATATWLSPMQYCNYEVTAVTPAPLGGTVDALHFYSNCGAVMSGREGVALAPPGTRALTQGGDWERVFSYAAGSSPTALNWSPDGRLIVDHDARAQVFRQIVVANGTRIEYRAH
jgi:hypothetical protein